MLAVSVPRPGPAQHAPGHHMPAPHTSSQHLGTVAFDNSCGAAVQAPLQRAVAMLHSFWFRESEKTFRAVLVQDPTCAIATWGIAAAMMDNPRGGRGPSAQWAQRGPAAIEQGQRIGVRTPRERDYLQAVAAYYQDWKDRPERARVQARARAFEALAARYPADDEAQIFAALYLASTQAPDDQTYASYLKAAAVLEPLFVRHPDHPGVAHYLIHSYDAPPIAHKGLAAARRYAGIAPAAAHALHMPSHIFTRVGAWAESAATNERSAAAAQRDGDPDGRLHAMDYMAYAYLQLAHDGEARCVVEDVARLAAAHPQRTLNPYAVNAIPARQAVERGDWRQAMTLAPSKGAEVLVHFARALGAARSGDPGAATREVERLAAVRDDLKRGGDGYCKAEEALGLMRQAADTEDRSEKHIITPGRIAPARELLGELLLELGRPAEALREFEASQQREPDRFRGLYAAGQAAARSGDVAKAKRYFARLLEMTGPGAARPELAQARAFLAAN